MKLALITWIFAVLTTIVTFWTPETNAAQINFTPSAFSSVEYNDNIFLTPDNETDDYITKVGIGLRGEVLWQKASVVLNYKPSYQWYKDTSDRDYWRHEASGDARFDFTRNTRMELRNTYLRTSDPSDESDFVDEDAPLDGRDVDRDLNRRGLDEYYQNVATARLEHRFGKRDNAYLGFRYSRLRDIDASATSNREENDIYTPSAGLAYWFRNQWGTELSGEYSHRDLKIDNNRDVYDGTGRLLYRFSRHFDGYLSYKHTYVDYDDETTDSNYTVYRPGVGVFYQFSENSHVRLGLGYYIQNTDSNDNPGVNDDDSQGFNVDSEIYKAWPFRRGNISLPATSGYRQDDTGSQDNGFNIYYQGRVNADYALLRRLTTDAYIGYRWDDYPDQQPSRTDKTLQAGVGLAYQPLPWLTSRLEYTLRDKHSDRNQDEYTENRVFFSITISPELPIRLLH
jgi:hypothetical protein